MSSKPLPFIEQDPMELVGMVVPGEPGELEAMAEAIVEEYVQLGWSEKRLLTLFMNPFFLATHRIYRQKGRAYVETMIRDIYAQWRLPADKEQENGDSL